MAPALAWFLTWSCYGTRLHGDHRGTVDDDHNLRGRPKLDTDHVKENIMRARMSQLPMALTSEARKVVEASVREHADVRSLRLLALYSGSNHVHVVVQTAKDETLEKIMQRFKMWATRALVSSRHIQRERRVWADHGSTLWLNTPEEVASKVDYVMRLQTHPARFASE